MGIDSSMRTEVKHTDVGTEKSVQKKDQEPKKLGFMQQAYMKIFSHDTRESAIASKKTVVVSDFGTGGFGAEVLKRDPKNGSVTTVMKADDVKRAKLTPEAFADQASDALVKLLHDYQIEGEKARIGGPKERQAKDLKHVRIYLTAGARLPANAEATEALIAKLKKKIPHADVKILSQKEESEIAYESFKDSVKFIHPDLRGKVTLKNASPSEAGKGSTQGFIDHPEQSKKEIFGKPVKEVSAQWIDDSIKEGQKPMDVVNAFKDSIKADLTKPYPKNIEVKYLHSLYAVGLNDPAVLENLKKDGVDTGKWSTARLLLNASTLDKALTAAINNHPDKVTLDSNALQIKEAEKRNLEREIEDLTKKGSFKTDVKSEADTFVTTDTKGETQVSVEELKEKTDKLAQLTKEIKNDKEKLDKFKDSLAPLVASLGAVRAFNEAYQSVHKNSKEMEFYTTAGTVQLYDKNGEEIKGAKAKVSGTRGRALQHFKNVNTSTSQVARWFFKLFNKTDQEAIKMATRNERADQEAINMTKPKGGAEPKTLDKDVKESGATPKADLPKAPPAPTKPPPPPVTASPKEPPKADSPPPPQAPPKSVHPKSRGEILRDEIDNLYG